MALSWEEEDPLKIDSLIEYLEETKEEDWCEDVVMTKDGKCCLLGHVHNYGTKKFRNGPKTYEMFEQLYATEFMVFPVNDGKNSRYPEATPKQRCVTYVKNLRDGSEKTTLDHMREYDEANTFINDLKESYSSTKD